MVSEQLIQIWKRRSQEGDLNAQKHLEDIGLTEKWCGETRDVPESSQFSSPIFNINSYNQKNSFKQKSGRGNKRPLIYNAHFNIKVTKEFLLLLDSLGEKIIPPSNIIRNDTYIRRLVLEKAVTELATKLGVSYT